MPQGAVLALDFGSSSVRAVVCDGGTAAPLQVARRPVSARGDAEARDGAATLDAEGYLGELVACLDELAARGALDGVTRVAWSTQWHSLLAVDGAGRPLTGALTWADTRATVRDGRAPADPADYHRRTGAWHHRLYWTVRIPWLRAQLGTRAAGFLGLPDYVGWRLTGERVTSPSVASGTGLLDLGACGWDDEALALAGAVRGELPEIAPHATTARLAGDWARRWPPLAGVPWHRAVGDGAASNVGVGAVHAGIASVTVGTSAAIRVTHPATGAPRLSPYLWRYRVDDTRVVTGRAFSVGGNVYPWVRELLGGDAAGVSEPRCAPGESGLVVVPLHGGSRPPETVPVGSGAVLGLSLQTTADELLAASLEGVALEAATALDQLEESFGAGLTVVLGGGAVHASPWWRGAFAAVMDRPVLVGGDAEVGAIGAAALALGIDPALPTESDAADPAAAARLRPVRGRYAAARRSVVELSEE